MSAKEKTELTFICQVRYGGAKGSSIIVTIPTEIVGLMKLTHKDYVKIQIKKIKPEDL
jgi:hypothetical protein